MKGNRWITLQIWTLSNNSWLVIIVLNPSSEKKSWIQIELLLGVDILLLSCASLVGNNSINWYTDPINTNHPFIYSSGFNNRLSISRETIKSLSRRICWISCRNGPTLPRKTTTNLDRIANHLWEGSDGHILPFAFYLSVFVK